jgi:hypothetical protein
MITLNHGGKPAIVAEDIREFPQQDTEIMV